MLLILKKSLGCFLVVGALGLVAGCATAPSAPEYVARTAQVAVIRGQQMKVTTLNYRITLPISVDGVFLREDQRNMLKGIKLSSRVDAGSHVIGVALQDKNNMVSGTFTFELRAGATYRFDAIRNPHLSDSASKLLLSGVREGTLRPRTESDPEYTYLLQLVDESHAPETIAVSIETVLADLHYR